MRTFKIRNDQQLYWNNRQKWVNYINATVFYENELIQISLPIDAKDICWTSRRGNLINTEDAHAVYNKYSSMHMKWLKKQNKNN